jgi:hypothetical protein
MRGVHLRKHAAEKPPEPDLKLVRQVSLLPEGMQKAIRELLVQGATIEGAVESVNERDDWNEPAAEEDVRTVRYCVTADAVREYYNADRELQRERAHYLVETTEAIKRSLSKSGDVEEGEARWVHSVVMAGLTRVNEKDTPLSVKDSIRARHELQVLILKKRLMKLKMSELSWHRAFQKSQKALVDQKRRFVFEQTVKLRDMMHKLEKNTDLTPDTFRKIQETYGMLAENVAQATAAQPHLALPESATDSGEVEVQPLYFAKEEDAEDPRVQMRKTIDEHYRMNLGKDI